MTKSPDIETRVREPARTSTSAPHILQRRDDHGEGLVDSRAGSQLDAAYLCRINTAVARLDRWFDTMRSDAGYGGPVAHWWQQSLMYTGPGLDWRYEGIIQGYLTLWDRTAHRVWRDKAVRAGNDLVAGQREDGHFRASAFEQNPSIGGTPHEAACDIGLLSLATRLREEGDDRWSVYAECARRNLERFYIGRLWDATSGSLGDSSTGTAFVPNKAATACEALFLLANVTAEGEWAERYALPTLNRIVEHQVRDGFDLDGAIAQNSLGDRRVEKYFPIYIARCVSGLLRGYEWTGQEVYLDSALRAMSFVSRWASGDGSLPTVVYENRRASWNPSWIAPLGDVLRAAEELAPYGLAADFAGTAQRLLNGQDATGGIQTASGFAGQAGGEAPADVPDVRDLLHVAGWCDKAFRYLSRHVGPDLPASVVSLDFEAECVFQGRGMRFVETPELIEISAESDVRYRWHKGSSWPEVAAEEFWLR